METQVLMKRPFFGHEISQQSKSGLFNASELVRICNMKRAEVGKSAFNFSSYLKNKQTIEFIEELQKTESVVISKGKLKNSTTWVHPLLFIDIALSIDPKFKVHVYSWIMDELLKYRNDSGDSYKKMCGALYEKTSDKSRFHKNISSLAVYIKNAIKVDDWNKATEEQLKMRDKIHNNIYLLCSVLADPKQAIRIGVEKALNDK